MAAEAPTQQIPAVQPQPVPTSFNVAQVINNTTGDILAQISISTPTGTFVVFLDPASTRAVGQALVKIGDISATGLIIP